jgi:hypothetical protein
MVQCARSLRIPASQREVLAAREPVQSNDEPEARVAVLIEP